MSGTTMDDDSRSISFKKAISLEDLSKASGHFNKCFKLLAKRDATYKEFTAWLATTDFVDVSPSLADINKMMEAKSE